MCNSKVLQKIQYGQNIHIVGFLLNCPFLLNMDFMYMLYSTHACLFRVDIVMPS